MQHLRKTPVALTSKWFYVQFVTSYSTVIFGVFRVKPYQYVQF